MVFLGKLNNENHEKHELKFQDANNNETVETSRRCVSKHALLLNENNIETVETSRRCVSKESLLLKRDIK